MEGSVFRSYMQIDRTMQCKLVDAYIVGEGQESCVNPILGGLQKFHCVTGGGLKTSDLENYGT